MHFNVTIETRRMEDGTFRADVVDGPKGVSGGTSALTRQEAYEAATGYVREIWSQDTFSFMHVKG